MLPHHILDIIIVEINLSLISLHNFILEILSLIFVLLCKFQFDLPILLILEVFAHCDLYISTLEDIFERSPMRCGVCYFCSCFFGFYPTDLNVYDINCCSFPCSTCSTSVAHYNSSVFLVPHIPDFCFV